MTPCEKLGYKVGDRFEMISDSNTGSALTGDIVILNRDDNSDCPWFTNERNGFDGCCIRLQHIRPLRATITPGTYVDTSGMDEAGRREVVDLFIKAGVPEGEGYRYANSCLFSKLGYAHDGVFYSNEKAPLKTEITLSQLREAAGVKVLPAVGSVMEVAADCDEKGDEVTVFAHYNGFAFAWHEKIQSAYHSDDPADFRPVRSQREKDIEQCQTECSLKPKQAARVVDAGYVKP